MSTGADWMEQLRRLAEGLRGTADPAEEPAHGADCRWCPICQVAAVVRGERPEVTAALADLLTTTAAALRAFAEAPAQPPAQPSAQFPWPDDEPGDPPPEVQRIEIA